MVAKEAQYHDATSKQKPIKGHRLHSKVLDRPITSQILPYIICRPETRTGNEANVVILADNTIGCQNWLMEILKGMMSTAR